MPAVLPGGRVSPFHNVSQLWVFDEIANTPTADKDATFYELHVCADGSWCCSPNASQKCCLADGNGDVILNLRDILPIAKAVTVTVAGVKSGSTATISFTTSVAAVTKIATETVTDAGRETLGVSTDAVANANACPKDRSTIVVASVGAVLGACLIASLIALGVVLQRQKGHRRAEARGMFYLPSTPPVEMDSRYVVELDSRAKHELGGRPVS